MTSFICILNIDEISQPTTEIKLLPVSENGRSLYGNSTSGFDVDLYDEISQSAAI